MKSNYRRVNIFSQNGERSSKLTGVEKTLTYAAPIWGHKLNKCSKEVLTSCQHRFALTIVKAYGTTPTAVLQILVGLIPIYLHVKYEAAYGSTARETVNIRDTISYHADYIKKIKIWKTYLEDTVESRPRHNGRVILMYTDGYTDTYLPPRW